VGPPTCSFRATFQFNFPNTYRACGNAGSRRLNSATTHLGSHKLHDLYVPPFEAAVGDGGLQSVIDFHSPVDGIPVAASRAILTDSLGEAFPA